VSTEWENFKPKMSTYFGATEVPEVLIERFLSWFPEMDFTDNRRSKLARATTCKHYSWSAGSC